MLKPPTPAPRGPLSLITRSKAIRWTAVGLWAAVIFSASSLPGSQVPGRFGTLAHFIEYAVLAALVFAALRLDRSELSSAVFAVAIASAYAVTDELHQAFVPGRVPDVADWAVDTAGATIAVAGILILSRAFSAPRQ
jgi:VanZ family protein